MARDIVLARRIGFNAGFLQQGPQQYAGERSGDRPVSGVQEHRLVGLRLMLQIGRRHRPRMLDRALDGKRRRRCRGVFLRQCGWRQETKGR
jgi:hypothetical protein